MKITKQKANYRPARNMDKRCGNCRMLRRSKRGLTCTLVKPDGKDFASDYIRSDYTCDYWEK